MIKIWVDDERPMPEGYDIWCHSTNEAIAEIARIWGWQYSADEGLDITISIDHDAGQFVDDGGDFVTVLKAYSQPWASFPYSKTNYEGFFSKPEDGSPLKVHFHSANPVGVKNMRAIVEHCPWMEEV